MLELVILERAIPDRIMLDRAMLELVILDQAMLAEDDYPYKEDMAHK